jgi:hypothetical protein
MGELAVPGAAPAGGVVTTAEVTRAVATANHVVGVNFIMTHHSSGRRKCSM